MGRHETHITQPAEDENSRAPGGGGRGTVELNGKCRHNPRSHGKPSERDRPFLKGLFTYQNAAAALCDEEDGTVLPIDVSPSGGSVAGRHLPWVTKANEICEIPLPAPAPPRPQQLHRLKKASCLNYLYELLPGSFVHSATSRPTRIAHAPPRDGASADKQASSTGRLCHPNCSQ